MILIYNKFVDELILLKKKGRYEQRYQLLFQ